LNELIITKNTIFVNAALKKSGKKGSFAFFWHDNFLGNSLARSGAEIKKSQRFFSRFAEDLLRFFKGFSVVFQEILKSG